MVLKRNDANQNILDKVNSALNKTTEEKKLKQEQGMYKLTFPNQEVAGIFARLVLKSGYTINITYNHITVLDSQHSYRDVLPQYEEFIKNLTPQGAYINPRFNQHGIPDWIGDGY